MIKELNNKQVLNRTFKIFTNIKKTMGHCTSKGAVCEALCFLDDPKLKILRLQPQFKECDFQFMDIINLNSVNKRARGAYCSQV